MQPTQLNATHATLHCWLIKTLPKAALCNTRSLVDPPSPNLYLISGFMPLTLLHKRMYDPCIYDTGPPVWEIRAAVGLVHPHYKVRVSEHTHVPTSPCYIQSFHLLLRPENIGWFQISMYQSGLKMLLLFCKYEHWTIYFPSSSFLDLVQGV